jgi:ketosteroid isomerase-like protein
MTRTLAGTVFFGALVLLSFARAREIADRAPSAGQEQVADRGPDPSAAIEAILKAQQGAWNRGDLPGFLEGYWNSPELTFAGSDGIVRGYDGLVERYRKTYPDRSAMGELLFSGLETRILGPEAALVVGHWQLKRSKGDVGGVFTLVFRRFATGWRIVHDHTSAQK